MILKFVGHGLETSALSGEGFWVNSLVNSSIRREMKPVNTRVLLFGKFETGLDGS